MNLINVILFIGCLLLIILFILVRIRSTTNSGIVGGNDKYKSIVVDTLNITHQLYGKKDTYQISHNDIIKAIKTVTKKLKPHVDNIIFVTKSKESLEQSPEHLRESFINLSKELKVHIYLVEKLKNPKQNKHSKSHSALGRDDFYAIITAWKLRCPILGHDHYKDLKDMKYGELDSFYVRRYFPFKKYAVKDYVNPTAPEYRKIRRPRIIHLDEFDGKN